MFYNPFIKQSFIVPFKMLDEVQTLFGLPLPLELPNTMFIKHFVV